MVMETGSADVCFPLNYLGLLDMVWVAGCCHDCWWCCRRHCPGSCCTWHWFYWQDWTNVLNWSCCKVWICQLLVPINVCCAQLVPIVVWLSSYDAGKAKVKLEIARVWRLLWGTPLGKEQMSIEVCVHAIGCCIDSSQGLWLKFSCVMLAGLILVEMVNTKCHVVRSLCILGLFLFKTLW